MVLAVADRESELGAGGQRCLRDEGALDPRRDAMTRPAAEAAERARREEDRDADPFRARSSV